MLRIKAACEQITARHRIFGHRLVIEILAIADSPVSSVSARERSKWCCTSRLSPPPFASPQVSTSPSSIPLVEEIKLFSQCTSHELPKSTLSNVRTARISSNIALSVEAGCRHGRYGIQRAKEKEMLRSQRYLAFQDSGFTCTKAPGMVASLCHIKFLVASAAMFLQLAV